MLACRSARGIPPTLATRREKCLRKKAIEMRFLSFNREQALAKLTWWLSDSNVKQSVIRFKLKTVQADSIQ
jgi:hypothetical protein